MRISSFFAFGLVVTSLSVVGIQLLQKENLVSRVSISIASAHALVAAPPEALATTTEDIVEDLEPTSPSSKNIRPGSEYPVRLIVPSIGLDAPIQNVGKNAKGEMDVPDGDTDNVGWYKPGTVPGARGSAVFAAHVYAIFEQLDTLVPGNEIFVETTSGAKLLFIVESRKTYRLGELSPEMLFNRKDARRLNLITCAGTFVKNMGTYDHRLVIFTKLVED